jgi:hypothetical protein
MPDQLKQNFFRERLYLSSGGVFDFDAVSGDKTVAVTISTSGARTATGKYAVGKMHKIRSDMFFLLLADVKRRIVILTEKDMYEQCLKEREAGRVPKEIEFIHAEIPGELNRRLVAARARASGEVTLP